MMKSHSSFSGYVALGVFLALVSVVAVGIASAQEDGATAPAAPAAPAVAGDLTGAAQVGSGVAVDETMKGGDMKAAGQKGVAAGVDAYMGGTPTAPAAVPAPDAAPAAE